MIKFLMLSKVSKFNYKKFIIIYCLLFIIINYIFIFYLIVYIFLIKRII